MSIFFFLGHVWIWGFTRTHVISFLFNSARVVVPWNKCLHELSIQLRSRVSYGNSFLLSWARGFKSFLVEYIRFLICAFFYIYSVYIVLYHTASYSIHSVISSMFGCEEKRSIWSEKMKWRECIRVLILSVKRENFLDAKVCSQSSMNWPGSKVEKICDFASIIPSEHFYLLRCKHFLLRRVKHCKGLHMFQEFDSMFLLSNSHFRISLKEANRKR